VTTDERGGGRLGPWEPQEVRSAYRALLESLRAEVTTTGFPPLTSHWPLVGTAPDRLMVVGQAVYGWIPDWRAGDLLTREGFEHVMADTKAACYERADPMNWIEENRVRGSPFWRMVRGTVERLWPGSAWNWYNHVVWTNLYPIAPNEPKGNPSGTLLEVQTKPAARLLRTVADALQPAGVLVLGGPYWWPFQEFIPLRVLDREQRPLLAEGEIGGVKWLVRLHPAGAQRRGWKASDYAALAASRLRA
jgi:hypothetical protein